MYDQDSSGEITPDEMVEIFSLMYAVQVLLSVKNTAVNEKEDDNCFSQHNTYITNTQGCTEGEGKAQAKKVFEALDIDKDGKIGIEEFITVGQTSMNITSRCQMYPTFQQSSTYPPF